MGRSRKHKRNRAQIVKATNGVTSPTTAQLSGPSAGRYTADRLLEKAEEMLVAGDLELCCKFCVRILQQEPYHVGALELIGATELELGKVEEARDHFLLILGKATPEQPELSSAHLYLAQLVETPPEAVAHFEAALDLLRERLDALQPRGQQEMRLPSQWSIEEGDLRRACSRCLVGLTELYMTDLCFADDAADRCARYTDLAIELDPTDPDALATKASVLLSLQNPVEAKAVLLASFALWKDLEERPPVETRLKCARLMLECDMAEDASDVLHGVAGDEEDNPDVWYLLSIASGILVDRMDPDDTERLITARHDLELCLAIHEREKECGEEAGYADGVIQHAKELLAKLVAAGVPAPPAEYDGGDSGSDGWTDDDDDHNDDDDRQDVSMQL